MSESISRPAAGARIVLKDVTKTYPGQAGPAVESFSMDIAPGELIMFVGPSGCEIGRASCRERVL